MSEFDVEEAEVRRLSRLDHVYNAEYHPKHCFKGCSLCEIDKLRAELAEIGSHIQLAQLSHVVNSSEYQSLRAELDLEKKASAVHLHNFNNADKALKEAWARLALAEKVVEAAENHMRVWIVNDPMGQTTEGRLSQAISAYREGM